MVHKFPLQEMEKQLSTFFRCTVIFKIFHWLLQITSIIKNWNTNNIYIFVEITSAHKYVYVAIYVQKFMKLIGIISNYFTMWVRELVFRYSKQH